MYRDVRRKIPFLAGAKIKNEIYFSAMHMNGLFKYNYETEECSFITVFEGECVAPCLHRKAFVCGNEIWFMPCEAKKIAMYDVDKGEMQYYKILDCEKPIAYWNGYRDGDILYFMPRDVRIPIAVIDLKTKNISMKKMQINLKAPLAGVVKLNDNYLLLQQDGELFSLKNNQIITLKDSTKEKIPYLSLIDDQEMIWFIPFDSTCIICYSKEKENTVCEIELGETYKYCFATSFDNKVVLFPTEHNRDFCVITKGHKKITYYKKHVNSDSEWLEMTEISCEDSKNLWIASSDGDIFEYNRQWELKNRFYTFIDSKIYQRCIEENISGEMFSSLYDEENRYLDLQMLLNVICKKN